MPELHTLTGLHVGESPRWHDGWAFGWGAQEIIAVDVEGRSEVMARSDDGPVLDRLAGGRAPADRVRAGGAATPRGARRFASDAAPT